MIKLAILARKCFGNLRRPVAPIDCRVRYAASDSWVFRRWPGPQIFPMIGDLIALLLIHDID